MRVSRRSMIAVLMSVVFGMAFVGANVPAPAPQLPDAAPSIADLGWLAGTWVREETAGQYLEEVWTAPVNNSLTGMFRWNRGGKPWMCELMTISLDGDPAKPVFRLRHFDAALKPWEKEAPLTYPLAKMSENEVVFEDPHNAPDHPRRFIYRRSGDTLTVRLENADGKGDAFEFTRATQGDSGATPKPGSSPIGFTGGLVVRFTVTDRARSRDWYRDMLGFEVLFEVEEIGWTEMTNHEAQLTIGLAQSEAVSVSTGTMPVVGVKDLNAARTHLESKGVRFTGETIEHAGLVRLATLLDPDGHQIMLYQALGD